MAGQQQRPSNGPVGCAASGAFSRPVTRRASLAALAGGALWSAATGLRARTSPPSPPELASELPGVQLRGSGAMRFLGARIYEARLWAPAAVTGDGASQPLALELIYARTIQGELIVSSSLREMRRVGSFNDDQSARWSQAMTALFPDIKSGDRLTGIQRPGQSARFYFNGGLRGEVADADFTRLFFGIWLSPRTSEPQLRQQLLNGS